MGPLPPPMQSPGTAHFYMDSGGNVFAPSFTPPPCFREFKQNIAALELEEACSLLDAVEPVAFTEASRRIGAAHGVR